MEPAWKVHGNDGGLEPGRDATGGRDNGQVVTVIAGDVSEVR